MLLTISLKGNCNTTLHSTEFKSQGSEMVGNVLCNASPIFKVSLSSIIKKDAYTRINLIPYDTQIKTFKILSKPATMDIIASDSESKTLAWRPAQSFNATASVTIQVQPIYTEDSNPPSGCGIFTIELPVENNHPPKVLIKNGEYSYQIATQGASLSKKINVRGVGPGEILKLFDDENLETLQITPLNVHPSINTSNLGQGYITLQHSGAVPTPINFELNLEAKDDLGQKSDPVTINFTIVADGATAPIITLCSNSERTLPDHRVATEREPFTIESVWAVNPATGEKCSIKIVDENVTTGYNIDEITNVLTWTPIETFIHESKGTSIEQSSFNIVATTSTGISSTCKFKFKIRNATTKFGAEKYKDAIETFSNSEIEFLNSIRTPLCFLEYASKKVSNNQQQIKAIQDIYTGADGIYSIAATANPVAIGIYSGVGLVIQTLSSQNNTRAENIKAEAQRFQGIISNYKELTTKFTQMQGELDENFKTDKECLAMFELSEQIKASLSTLKTQMPSFIAITAYFNQRTMNRMIQICGSPSN